MTKVFGNTADIIVAKTVILFDVMQTVVAHVQHI